MFSLSDVVTARQTELLAQADARRLSRRSELLSTPSDGASASTRRLFGHRASSAGARRGTRRQARA